MDWLNEMLQMPAEVYAVVVIAVICAVGISLGKLGIKGISLGVTFVFFAGILAGHCGLHIDARIQQFAMNFGLVLFVYTLGLQVGPGFMSAFRQGGAQLNMIAMGVVLLGTVMALVCSWVTDVSLPDMVGVLCGATTNTPALGAAQQTLVQMGLGDNAASLSLGCAVTYPLGVVGVIIAYILLRALHVTKTRRADAAVVDDNEEPFIVSFHVRNPAVVGHSLRELSSLTQNDFVVSRLWRNNEVLLPESATTLQQDDRVLVITKQKEVERLTIFFGERDTTDWNKDNIDWNKLDRKLISRRIVITNHDINGKRLGALQLRKHFSVNVSRVNRAGLDLMASPDLRLCMGDRLTVVGEEQAVSLVASRMGNVVADLDEPNLVAIFVGIVIGLVVGSLPIALPSMSVPVSLGLAGGPVIVGILVGAFGPRFHMITYTTNSANRMLRALGLAMYLACLGLSAGPRFFDTVVRADGAIWIGLGFLLTLLPVVIVGWICAKFSRYDLPTVGGMLCGSMANPMALTYVNDTTRSDKASVAYTTVYPLCMFARVIIAQLVLLLFA